MEILVDPFGVDEFVAYMDEVIVRAENAAPVLSAIGEEIELLERRAFEGTPDLVDTGALRASLTSRHARGAVWEIHDDVARFGTAIPYAVYWWRELLQPLDAGPTADRWADMLGAWLESGGIGAAVMEGL